MKEKYLKLCAEFAEAQEEYTAADKAVDAYMATEEFTLLKDTREQARVKVNAARDALREANREFYI